VQPTAIGILGLVCMFGGALAGLQLRSLLPRDHLADESRDTIKLAIALVATTTALLLGLVTAAAKSSFDGVDSSIEHIAGEVLSVDRLLARYGPETAELRGNLRGAVARRIELTWEEDVPVPSRLEPADIQEAELLAAEVRRLSPRTDEQRWLRDHAMEVTESLLRSRWRTFATAGSSIPVPFLVVLLFWLTITFASFGLFAPPNPTVVSVLFLCALSIAGAIFLILEMDGPFEGVIRVSPDPLLYAVENMNQ
jgi:hypothetical protein